jgi:site-specific recombinase XerD
MQLNEATAGFLADYFSTHTRAKSTRIAYARDLEQFKTFVGVGIELLSVTASLIESWAVCLREKGYAPASVRRRMATLRVFFSYSMRRGLLSESPFWRVKLSLGRIQQLPRSLTKREAQTLLAHARQLYSNSGGNTCIGPVSKDRLPRTFRSYRTIRNSALVDLLFATGLRVGEMSSLDINDFPLTKEYSE